MAQLKINITQEQLDAVVRAAAAKNQSRAGFVRGVLAEATGVPDGYKSLAFNPRLLGRRSGWARQRQNLERRGASTTTT